MPINAPIEYFKAEERFKSAKTREEKIKALEDMLRFLPSHKGTENLRALLRKRLAKLRAKRERKIAPKPKFSIKKEGAAQVCLIGLTNSGKSTLLKKLTGVDVKIANYPYTTKEPVVGMMDYEDVKIQLVEIPSTFSKDVMSIVRNCDGIVFVLDGTKDLKRQKEELMRVMSENKIRINEEPKDIKVIRRGFGGIEIRGEKNIKADVNEVKEVLQASGYSNCLLVVNEEASIDDIMDALDRSLVYKNAIFVITKVPNMSIEEVKKEVWYMLGLIRVYTKSRMGEVEKKPLTLPIGSTIRGMIKKMGKEDWTKTFRFARVWGNSVKHGVGKVGLDHVLEDGDIVEIYA